MKTPQRQLLQLLVLAILCRPHSGVAQAAELLARWRADNPLHISGSVSSSLQTNAIRGIAARADPLRLHSQAHQPLRFRLDALGFAVSAGSACSSGTLKKSRVLDAFEVPDDVAARTIRVSLGWSTTPEDLERFAEAWASLC